MCKVAVLMSTYNGEKYLKEQVDSILSQKDVEIMLYVRDDGSSDSTIEIVKEYQKHNDNIVLYIGKNVGVGNSFMQLVYDAGNKFDYYAFADQDDVWLPDKLTTAVRTIEEIKKPCLYASNQLIVDQELKKIGMRFFEHPNISSKQIMCKNKLTGCTMVWNTELHRFLCNDKYHPSSSLLECRIHDVWVAMVASVVGVIIFDEKSYILYRQHENNVIGVKKTNIFVNWINKINYTIQRNGRSRICAEILEKYGENMEGKIIDELKPYAYYRNNSIYKYNLLKDKTMRKISGESFVGFSIKVLFNLI